MPSRQWRMVMVVLSRSRGLVAAAATGGSLKTIGYAKKHNKPCLHLSKAGGGLFPPAGQLKGFVKEHGITVLNVAGSRESKEPGIREWVMAVWEDAFFPVL